LDAEIMGQYLLAHDLGTSGNKAVLSDEKGNIIEYCVSSYTTQYPQPSFVEQDPEAWWKAVCESTRHLLNDANIDPQAIASVSFSGIMNSCLPVDRNLRSLRPAMIWADKRSVEESTILAFRIGLKEAYHISGQRIDPSYTISKILWLKKHQKDIYDKTYKFLQAKDYIVAKLIGKAFTDYSDASHLGCFDIQRMQWSSRILEEMGIDQDKFPEVITSTSIAGTINKAASLEIGLPEGLPVIIGGGDGCCATAGAGIAGMDQAYLNLGTSAWLATLSEEPVFCENYETFNFVYLDGKTFMPLGTMQSAGHSFEWALKQLHFSDTKTTDDFYKMISEEVEKVDSDKKLYYLPYLLGERSPWWNSDARGCFIGLDATTDSYAMLKAVVEGVSFNLRIIYESMSKNKDVSDLTMIGGLARNTIWIKTLADVFGIPMKVKQHLIEATSIGALMCAGIGVGIFDGFHQAPKLNPDHYTQEPRLQHTEIYQRKYQVFTEAYHAMESIFSKL
jgi:xylulokinase